MRPLLAFARPLRTALSVLPIKCIMSCDLPQHHALSTSQDLQDQKRRMPERLLRLQLLQHLASTSAKLAAVLLCSCSASFVRWTHALGVTATGLLQMSQAGSLHCIL